MANDNTIKTFTAIDIERYHKGQLSVQEMHAMEKAALDDPFLADALEGYAAPGVNAAADIADLKKRLEERSSETKVIPIAPAGRSFPWLRAAAMFVLVAGSGFLIYKLAFSDTKQANIAQAPSKEKSVVTDSITSRTDSSYNEPVGENSNYLMPGQEMKVSDSLTIQAGIGTFSKNKLKSDLTVNNLTIDTSKQSFSLKSYLLTIPDSKGLAAPASQTDTSFLAVKTKKAEANAPQYKILAPAASIKNSDDYYRARADSILSKNKDKDGVDDSINRFGFSSTIAIASQKRQANQGFFKENNQMRHNLFRGRVTDANNNALPFANITNTVDNVGTYSDAKGYFTLISPDSVLNVQVRSVGFENNTTQLQANLRDNQVVMQEDNMSLSEVVINNRAMNTNRTRNNTLVHEEPEPVDGWVNYDIYVANNLNIPDTLKRRPSFNRGEVELSFEVNKNGEPVNITVDKSLCVSCDKEAIRLLKEGPKWKHKSRKKKRTSVTISF